MCDGTRRALQRAGSCLTAVRHGRRSNIAGAVVRAACSEIAVGSALRGGERSDGSASAAIMRKPSYLLLQQAFCRDAQKYPQPRRAAVTGSSPETRRIRPEAVMQSSCPERRTSTTRDSSPAARYPMFQHSRTPRHRRPVNERSQHP